MRRRSIPASSDQRPIRSTAPGSSSQGARNPGTWAPWPGATISSTCAPFAGNERPGRGNTELAPWVKHIAGRRPGDSLGPGFHALLMKFCQRVDTRALDLLRVVEDNIYYASHYYVADLVSRVNY